MCTILLAWRCVPGASVVLAANRDEFFGRDSAAPAVLVEHPRVVGGRDLRSGGTWLGVAAGGRVAAVTNRLTTEWDPSRRSRGELPLSLLAGGAGEVRKRLAGLDGTAYNPFNLLYVSEGEALVGHNRGGGAARVDIVDLGPGAHVLTLHDVDQPGDAKVAFLAGRLEEALDRFARPCELLAAMEELLGEHGGGERHDLDCACVHGDGYGTVSSSSVIVSDDGRLVYRHTPGRPCETEPIDVSALLG